MYSKSENVALERVANWLHLASPLLCATYIYGLALALKNFRECYVGYLLEFELFNFSNRS